jgi:hypothetical protein
MKSEEGGSSMENMGEEMKEDVYVLLSPYERAAVHAVQFRKPGATPVNWNVMAADLKVSVPYFQALCTISLPKSSNEIPYSRIQRAMWSVSLGRVFLY